MCQGARDVDYIYQRIWRTKLTAVPLTIDSWSRFNGFDAPDVAVAGKA